MENLRYISIKTQVRRLKYFSVLLELLNTKGTRKDIIEKDIISWSERNHSYFKLSSFQTGEIVRSKTQKSSQSFTNYYDAFKKFKLIDELNEFIIPSRIGSIYKAIHSELKVPINTSGYELNSFEKIFFLFIIFRSDSDYFLTILEMIYNNPGELQEYYIRHFQYYYINHLESKTHSSLSSNNLAIVDSLNRVKNWRSPDRYCEDIVPPRINWIMDFSLIDNNYYNKSKNLKLNSLGMQLFKNITIENVNLLSNYDVWINTSFLKAALPIFLGNLEGQIIYWFDLNELEKIQITNSLFDLISKHFSVLGLPKVSLEQSLIFCSLYALLTSNILVEINELIDWIGFEKNLGKRKIGIRYSARIYEAYIFIENN